MLEWPFPGVFPETGVISPLLNCFSVVCICPCLQYIPCTFLLKKEAGFRKEPVTQNVKECFGRHCAVSRPRGKRNEIHPRPQAFHAPQAHFTL